MTLRTGSSFRSVRRILQGARAVTCSRFNKPASLSGTNRRHGFIPLPVYGISPRHSLILFIGGPVNISLMMMRNEDSAFFSSTRGALPFLQPAVHQQCRDRTAAPTHTHPHRMG